LFWIKTETMLFSFYARRIDFCEGNKPDMGFVSSCLNAFSLSKDIAAQVVRRPQDFVLPVINLRPDPAL
jgi:hypothetical protein